MSTPTGPRSIKISDDERGAWTSDRPRRDGRPPRPLDVSVRSRVLRPADRLRYSPGSIVIVVSPVRAERDRLLQRVIEDRSALLSLDKVRALLAGRVAEEEIEARAEQLLDAALAKRLQANESIVIAADTLAREERERYVRLAAAHRRARHIVLVEAGKDSVAEEDRAPLTELRNRLDAGELGQEGFMTSLRLGGRNVEELKKIIFAPPPADD